MPKIVPFGEVVQAGDTAEPKAEGPSGQGHYPP
jgi:hypothetical protein